MYTVMIVDDEPLALHLIEKIIKKRCPEFTVQVTAENGAEALEKLDARQPDLIITDVKMPVMDGIELVRRVKTRYPEILSLIISGYQEFEYVSGAIQSEACDYLLKPVIPSRFTQVMGKIQCRLEAKHARKRLELLRRLVRGKPVEKVELRRYFSDTGYYAAIIRKNGLPGRFSAWKELENFSEEYQKVMIYGRDEREALYICPESVLYRKTFPEIIEDFGEKYEYRDGYFTILISREAHSIENLWQYIYKMYDMLHRVIRVGKSQTVILEDTVRNADTEDREKTVMRMLETHLSRGERGKFKTEARSCLKKWIQEGCTQLQLESMVRQIHYIIQRYGQGSPWEEEQEFLLEDIFFNASSQEEMLENIEIFLDLKSEVKADGKVDTEDFFYMVTEYVKSHLSDLLTLQQICRTFGVSQTYLSRLFRKYGNISYNGYVTRARIEYAKKIMEEEENLYIRDIAEMVGYGDQFYFSRIFRSVTGVCPSDYIGGIRRRRKENE